MSRFADRWADISLRAKITGVTVFILFLGLIVAGVGTLSVLQPLLSANQTNRLIQLRTDPTSALAPGAATNALERGDVLYANQRYYVALLGGNGDLQYDNTMGRIDPSIPHVPTISLEQAMQADDSIITLRSDDGSEWRAVVAPILADNEPRGILLIAESTSGINQVIANYVTVFTGFGIAVILLGAALTRLLITTTMMPLAEVERTALEIARGDYSKRILVDSPHTEVGHLGESLNAMLDRLDGSLEDQARTIERMRRFIGDASHELRTPLVSVRGYAELYRMGAIQEDEQVAQAMERIEKEAIRMTSLVEDLLALARLDEGRVLERTSLDLNSFAVDAASDARAQAPDRSVSVVADPSNPCAFGDEHKVRQLMTNLIGNAMRHTAEGSPIEIIVSVPHPDDVLPPSPPAPTTSQFAAIGTSSAPGGAASSSGSAEPSPAVTAAGVASGGSTTTPPAGAPATSDGSAIPASSAAPSSGATVPLPPMVRFEIVDHGDGVPEQIREKIFDRFWRADNSRNRETGGSGLGLAIAKSIVDVHRGSISVHETPGGGATFRVDLPAAE